MIGAMRPVKGASRLWAWELPRRVVYRVRPRDLGEQKVISKWNNKGAAAIALAAMTAVQSVWAA